MMDRIYDLQSNRLNNDNVGNISNHSVGQDIEVIINRLYKGEIIAELYHGAVYINRENKEKDLKHYLAVAFTSDRVILGRKFDKEYWVEQKDGSVCREFIQTIPLCDVINVKEYSVKGNKFIDITTKGLTITLIPYQKITEDLTPKLLQAVEKYQSNNTKINQLLKIRNLYDSDKLDDHRFIYHICRILD